MRLLYLTTSYNPALLDRVHEEFLLRLIEQGHTTTIIVPDPTRQRRQRWQIETGLITVVRPAVSATRADRALNLISKYLTEYDYFLTLLRAYLIYLRQHPEIDIIHVESVYPLGAVAAVASLFDRRPFVPTIRGGDLIADTTIGYGFARFRRVRMLLHAVWRRASAVRAVSPGAAAMAQQFGCPATKLLILGRNIRNEYFLPDPTAFRAEARAWLHKHYPQIGERQIIVAAGRLLPVKGFDDLIRAMAALPHAVALICGPNRVDEAGLDHGAYLAELAQQRGVSERVIFTGGIPREQMTRYFGGATVLAVPSLIEGGNRTLLEAATLGVPFVATDTAGTPAFFTAAEGITIPPQRPDLLSAALALILAESPAQQATRSASCIVRSQQFRSSSVARRLADVYRHILDTTTA